MKRVPKFLKVVGGARRRRRRARGRRRGGLGRGSSDGGRDPDLARHARGGGRLAGTPLASASPTSVRGYGPGVARCPAIAVKRAYHEREVIAVTRLMNREKWAELFLGLVAATVAAVALGAIGLVEIAWLPYALVAMESARRSRGSR